MSVLILKNTPSEGPGTIEDFLRERGVLYKIVNCATEGIPGSKEFDILVMLGGPMSVNEEEMYPYVGREVALVKEFIAEGKKVFGICLGAQIMAKALGAKVYGGPEKEIGWHDIELTEEGTKDPLMKELAVHPRAGDFQTRFKVFHWHGETFDIPKGAVRLAKSELYPHQAFRYGEGAFAFQFHIEVRKGMIYEWLKGESLDMNHIRRQTEEAYDDYLGRAVKFYKAFFRSKKFAGGEA
ncbi:MAG TPA: gamma-glutamyl-gamma-aminobutyrate hydrolase family protein [Thermodesulfovibrionales bacterium]|nr:gamma-glutamyl-gamma-aminobutyrate hydrolase family protein [Thermodesulfovibrionales bacterium]